MCTEAAGLEDAMVRQGRVARACTGGRLLASLDLERLVIDPGRAY